MKNKLTYNDLGIEKIENFLGKTNLCIPTYQRPYKWTEKNVNQLIDDIIEYKEKPAYRVGTIVLHKDKDKNNNDILNIVDGQQRTITFLLIAHYLKNSNFDLEIPDNQISKNNILRNNELIEYRLSSHGYPSEQPILHMVSRPVSFAGKNKTYARHS